MTYTYGAFFYKRNLVYVINLTKKLKIKGSLRIMGVKIQDIDTLS